MAGFMTKYRVVLNRAASVENKAEKIKRPEDLTKKTAARAGRKMREITAAALIGSMILFSAALAPTPFAADKNAESGKNTDMTGGRSSIAHERVIAHGGGSYRGYETTNSAEAVKNAIANGYKIIELDMRFSSDRKIIMLHDWDRTAKHYYGTDFPKKLSRNRFLRLKVHGELEVLDFDKLAGILDENPDIRIVTDTKEDCLEILACIAEQYPGYADRFIPQIYDFDQLSEVKRLGYRDVILTLYTMADPDPERIAAFAREQGLYAVTMPDYIAEKGICRRISSQGIIVYVHPVTAYEDARRFMSMGAFGVYSGALLPSEFTGIEGEYYLTAVGPEGSEVKLSDAMIKGPGELKLHGQKPEDTVLFYIDDSRRPADDSDFSELKPGKHALTVKISSRDQVKGTLVYYLWKENGCLRVLHKKYEYRLDAVKQEKDFRSVMRENRIPQEIEEILSRSLIAKAGEYIFYADGSRESYLNGEEPLAVQKGAHGRLMLPLSATAQKLGADSVTMSREKDLTVIFNGEKNMIMVDSNIVRRGFRQTRLNTKVILYLNKAMASGEFFRCVTGREFIEMDDLIIILPAGIKPDSRLTNQLSAAAGKLF